MEYEQKQQLFRASESLAWELFGRAPAVRFAAVSSGGQPVLRTLNAVVLDGCLCFHGRDKGEKLGLIGRPALASYDEVVAEVPSYWLHPQLACPASTYYLSAIAEGRVERIADLQHKARVLSAMMERFQPEGGYDPIRADDRRYAVVLEKLLVARFVPERVTAKRKLGQHRSVAQIEHVLEGLWRRGRVSDLPAIRAVREAHPERPVPAFLRGPLGTVLCVAPDAQDARAVATLLEGQYWTHSFTLDRMSRAQVGSNAWVVARDGATGAVVASARAITDQARFGYVLDVVVRSDLRGQGFGTALMRLLLDHPAVRGLHSLVLRTRDAHPLYEKFGFECRSDALQDARRIETMALVRA